MSKPEDIPQDVWNVAQTVESDCVNATWNGSAKGTRTISETIIARAILAAEKRGEERERAACEEIAAIQADADGNPDMQWQARIIRDAIRKRGV